jgi:hypothetical protein
VDVSAGGKFDGRFDDATGLLRSVDSSNNDQLKTPFAGVDRLAGGKSRGMVPFG